MNLCTYTEELWRLYLLGDMPEITGGIFEKMSKDIVIIGTGKHEYYEDLKQFEESVFKEEEERSQIHFEIESFWCEEKKLNEETSLVHGSVRLKGTGIDENVLIDMDTRFTMIYCKKGEDWKLAHIHQSIPYIEQMEGEYYPKTLMDQVSELGTKAKTDLLTGLLNHQAFYDVINKVPVSQTTGYLMVIDLDDFKQINDTYGHLYGDNVLKEIGGIFKTIVGEEDWAGRIGGDEFALFFGKLSSDKEAEAMAAEILCRVAERNCQIKLHLPGLSIGIMGKKAGESSVDMLKQADMKMYEAKRSGKNRYKL